MKRLKFMIPVMTLGLAVGLAFADTATVTSGWIDLDGIPTQLDSEPCQGTGEICRVKFDNDPQERVFEVYTDMSLTTLKDSNTTVPYQLPALP